jgi:hypothetical protein
MRPLRYTLPFHMMITVRKIVFILLVVPANSIDTRISLEENGILYFA